MIHVSLISRELLKRLKMEKEEVSGMIQGLIHRRGVSIFRRGLVDGRVLEAELAALLLLTSLQRVLHIVESTLEVVVPRALPGVEEVRELLHRHELARGVRIIVGEMPT